MGRNLKIALIFIIVSVLAIFIVSTKDRAFIKAKTAFSTQSENFNKIYGRKLFKVYSQLDEAYKVSDTVVKISEGEAKVDPHVHGRWPVFSFWIDPRDLYSEERGIIENGLKRGRLWERPAIVNYYEGGDKKFEGFAGVRLHGGASRRPKAKERSFRFSFRKEYGHKFFHPSTEYALNDQGRTKTLVIRSDRRYSFVHDLGFSLVRKLGGVAPVVQPVAVYINGEFYAYQIMTEHQNEQQMKYYLGDRQFHYYKLKKHNNDSVPHLLYEDTIARVDFKQKPMTLDYAKKLVDIESFTAAMLWVAYAGMTDWAQGIIFKEYDKAAPWKWLVWDFDNAFYIDRPRIKQPHVTKAWQIDSFKIALDFYTGSLPNKVFKRLIFESKEYQEYFKSKVDELFDTHLESNWLKQKISNYEAFYNDSNKNDHIRFSLDRMKNFIRNRKPIFCKQMKESLNFVASTCL